MKEYLEKVSKHIGIKKEAAIWKHVPQPGQMPKPPPSNTYRGKKKSHKSNMRTNKHGGVARGGKKRKKKTSKLDKFTANALSPRSLVPKPPHGENLESKDTSNVHVVDTRDSPARVSCSVNTALVGSEITAHVATTGSLNPTSNNTPKRPQTAKASLDFHDKSKIDALEDQPYRLSPRLRLLHHSNVKQVVTSRDLFSLDGADDEDCGKRVQGSKTKQRKTYKSTRRPRYVLLPSETTDL